ncbi:MAG: tetratricopeptide repeat protein [Oscillospiraceae bacterium]|jgi:tetratricopeptide (TPR) repeat protein|nr:tetratricopeptide repeat protein [Oscillospiraceae bacterium]
MGFWANYKGNRAYARYAKGDLEGAKTAYEQAYAQGMDAPRLLLTYAILLLRTGDYAKAAEVLRRVEKAPGLTLDQHSQMLVHYGVAMWKLGKMDRALEVLRDAFRRHKNTLTYSTLGFLLIEKGDADEALAFNREAMAYDEDDPVFLDNLAQTYYRLLGDKQAARPLFERALAHKPNAIDTNYFLSQYDLEEGKTEDALAKLQLAAQGRFSPLNHVTREDVQAQIEKLQA